MDWRVQTVIAFMGAHLQDDLSLKKMAQSVNLSPWWLCHLFRKETGVPPERYLKLLRMQRAKELLETTFLSVKEVMTRVGVSDESHFVRDFKRVYSLSPTQYRTRCHSADLVEGGLAGALQQYQPIDSKIG
jgi:transcriptional regulator GlxA family with amidase domain